MATEDSAAPSILVADDSEVNRTLLRRQLERAGYRVTAATDAAPDGHVARPIRESASWLVLGITLRWRSQRDRAEVIVAALGGEGGERLIAEAADLVFHLAALLINEGLDWNDVENELQRRAGR